MNKSAYDSEFWTRFSQIFAEARGMQVSEIFNPPATEENIIEIESHVGFRLPDDVRSAYQCFDGQHRLKEVNGTKALSNFNLFQQVNYWHSLSEALVTWNIYRRLCEGNNLSCSEYSAAGKFERAGWKLDADGGFDEMPLKWGPATHWPVIFDQMRFPLAILGHVTICIDMNPRPAGRQGQILECVITDGARWLAPSFGAHCERFCQLIESREIIWGDIQEWTSAATGKRIKNGFMFEKTQPR